MDDVFTRYETGLQRLLEQLGKEHPHYAEVLTLQSRLLENKTHTRTLGDTEIRRADRAQIVSILNQLASEVVGVSFNELCVQKHPPPPPFPEHTPFIGPRPFHFSDKNLFFGRDRCLDKLINKLVNENWPLLVINGLSGAGKTSLLRAGLVHRLQKEGYAVAYASILDSPESDVVQGIRDAFPDAEDSRSIDILEAVNKIACSQNRPFFLIVDQFERCFTLVPDKEKQRRFWKGIAHLIRGDARCSVKVVVAVRADWLYEFQKVRIPLDVFVYDFLFFVDPLNADEAREALIGPLKQCNIAYEPELIDAIVKDLASEEGYVNPPQLQIVGVTLYRHMRESGRGEAKLTLEDYYVRLHGARAIIRKHLANAMEHLEDTQAGWQILLKLIGPDKQRVNRREEELRGVLSPDKFNSIMADLVDTRIVIRELSSADKLPVYTLTHDYLIEEINDHFEDHPNLQAWRTAERYLDIGLADWRDAKRTTGQELLLERERYLHIWSQRGKLGALSEEANQFLLRTGLYYGESSFSHWLSKLSDDRSPLALKIIIDYSLYQDDARRQTAQKGVIEAIRENLLSSENQGNLKDLLWKEFESKEEPPQSESVQLTKKERREAAATILWALRRVTTVSEELRFAPTAGRIWVADHRKQIAMSVGSVLFTIVLVLTVWSIRESLRGKWYPVHSLLVGPVSAAAIHPDKSDIYIVVQRPTIVRDRATLLWSQGGGDWRILSRSFIYNPVSSLLVTYPNNKPRIYVSARGRGILRSDDNGTSWELINTGLRSYDIIVLVADPLNPNAIYAGSGDKRGVFETLDGGNTWRDISEDELFGASVFSMVYTPYEEGTFLAGTEDGRILARKRNVSTWRLVSAYPGAGAILQMSAEPEKGQYIYAGTSNGNVLVSPDGGASWVFLKRIPGVFGINSIAVVPGKPNVVYIDAFGIGGHIVWKSEDNGQDWRHVSDDQFTREEMRWLLIPRGEPDKLYAAGRAGFFETQDGGNSWIFHYSAGSLLASIDNIAISPFDDGPIYASVGGAIYSNSDPKGGAWKRGYGLLASTVRDIASDPNIPSIAYAGVLLPGKWSIFVTMDGGETWQPTLPPPNIPEGYLNDTMALDIAKIEGETILYAGTNGCGVIHTTDQGANWETWGRQDCLLPENAPKNIQDLVIDPHSANRLYVAADDARFFVTEDRGQTWQSYPTPLTTEITAIEADHEIEGRVYLIAGTEGFWRSDNGGKTWKPYSKRLEGRALTAMVAASDAAETLFVGATSGEVWKTTDGGQNWTSVRESLAVTDISTLASRALKTELLLGSVRDGIYQYQPGSLLGLWP